MGFSILWVLGGGRCQNPMGRGFSKPWKRRGAWYIEVILLTMVYRPTTYGILTHSPWNIEPTTVFRFEMRGVQNTL
jgi:hypothetical protein